MTVRALELGKGKYQISSAAALIILFLWIAIVFYTSQNPRLTVLETEANFGIFGILNSLLDTMARVMIGAGSAIFVGAGLAIILGALIKQKIILCIPAAFAFAVTPSPIWLSISVMIFGLSEWGTFFIVFVSSTFFVFAITAANIAFMQSRIFFLGQMFDHSWSQRIKWLLWPELRGSFVTTVRIAFLVGWTSIILAESSGSRTGLGAMLLFGRQLFDWQVVCTAWASTLVGALTTDWLLSNLGSIRKHQNLQTRAIGHG